MRTTTIPFMLATMLAIGVASWLPAASADDIVCVQSGSTCVNLTANTLCVRSGSNPTSWACVGPNGACTATTYSSGTYFISCPVLLLFAGHLACVLYSDTSSTPEDYLICV